MKTQFRSRRSRFVAMVLLLSGTFFAAACATTEVMPRSQPWAEANYRAALYRESRFDPVRGKASVHYWRLKDGSKLLVDQVYGSIKSYRERAGIAEAFPGCAHGFLVSISPIVVVSVPSVCHGPGTDGMYQPRKYPRWEYTSDTTLPFDEQVRWFSPDMDQGLQDIHIAEDGVRFVPTPWGRLLLRVVRDEFVVEGVGAR